MTRGNFEFLSSDFSRYMYKNYTGEFLVLFWKKKCMIVVSGCQTRIFVFHNDISGFGSLRNSKIMTYTILTLILLSEETTNWHIFLGNVVVISHFYQGIHYTYVSIFLLNYIFVVQNPLKYWQQNYSRNNSRLNRAFMVMIVCSWI